MLIDLSTDSCRSRCLDFGVVDCFQNVEVLDFFRKALCKSMGYMFRYNIELHKLNGFFKYKWNLFIISVFGVKLFTAGFLLWCHPYCYSILELCLRTSMISSPYSHCFLSVFLMNLFLFCPVMSLLQNVMMWGFQESLLSSVTPRYTL